MESILCSNNVQVLNSPTDIDECSTDTLNNCDINAGCMDIDGSFLCLCSDGYTGNGTDCEGMSFIHFEAVELSIYFIVDVDECVLNVPCDANALCTNTNGSFECMCNAGYTGYGLVCSGMALTYCWLLCVKELFSCNYRATYIRPVFTIFTQFI